MAIEIIKPGALTLTCECKTEISLTYSDLKLIPYISYIDSDGSQNCLRLPNSLRCPICNRLWYWTGEVFLHRKENLCQS